MLLTTKSTQLKALSLFLFVFATTILSAQSNFMVANVEVDKVQKYTVMERFDRDLVIPVNERKQLKRERRLIMVERRQILVTLDISERRRERLLKQLRKNPFSDKMARTFAKIKYEDELDQTSIEE